MSFYTHTKLREAYVSILSALNISLGNRLDYGVIGNLQALLNQLVARQARRARQVGRAMAGSRWGGQALSGFRAIYN